MTPISRRRVVMRADASQAIGSGHLMRSASLAHALNAYCDVTLLTATAAPGLIEHAERLGVKVSRLPENYRENEDAAIARDAAAVAIDLAILDGYHFDAVALDAWRRVARQVAMIDDAPRLESYPVDFLIDQNIGALRHSYRTPADARLLLGPGFTLLRPAFASTPRRQTSAVRRGLITFGGSDPANAMFRVVTALQSVALDIDWTVVVGAASRHAADVERACGTDGRFHVVRNVPDMCGLLASVDIAVMAVGGTMWESAAMGVPTILIGTSAVQSGVGASVGAYGAHLWLGEHTALSQSDLASAVGLLAADVERRRAMSSLGRALVDGRGAQRVAARLLSASEDWVVRPAAPQDSEPTWEIASAPDVRAQSFNSRPFPFAVHQPWFAERLQRPDCGLWVIACDGMVGGFVRYDRDGDRAVISIAVAAACRGRGLGTRLLRETSRDACGQLDVARVEGLVFDANPISQVMFLKAGFERIDDRRVDDRACAVFEWRTA